jgi:hypothetical protein
MEIEQASVQDQCIGRPSCDRIDLDHSIVAVGVTKNGWMGTACA